MKGIVRRIKGVSVKGRYNFRKFNFRGHGIHSPFAYGVVRHALLRPGTNPKDNGVYEYLTSQGIRHKTALKIQSLHDLVREEEYHYPNPDCKIYADVGLSPGKEFRIILPGEDPGLLRDILSGAVTPGGTVVVLHPADGQRRWKLCADLIAENNCVSIGTRDFVVYFYGRNIPPRHYKI